jgi:hypothetical protein
MNLGREIRELDREEQNGASVPIPVESERTPES